MCHSETMQQWQTLQASFIDGAREYALLKSLANGFVPPDII